MDGFPLIPGDSLLINLDHWTTTVSGVTITAICIDPKGRQTANIRTIAVITATAQVVMPMTTGFLVSVTATNNCTDLFSEIHINVGLRRDSLGANPYLLCLLDCFLCGTARGSWHYKTGLSLGPQTSVWRSVIDFDPAAGTDILIGDTLDGSYQLISLHFKLTTSVALGARLVQFSYLGPEGENWVVPHAYTQGPSLAYDYYYHYDVKVPRQVGTQIYCDLPLVHAPGFLAFGTATANIGVADQFSGIRSVLRALPCCS